MERHHIFPPLLVHLSNNYISAAFFFLLLLLAIPGSHSQEHDYQNCKKPFKCGLLDNLSYPFWGGKRPPNCGRKEFELTKCEEGDQYPLLMVTQPPFRVLHVNLSCRTMTIAGDDYLSNGICQENPSNITLDKTVLVYDPSRFQNISIFYNCTQYIVGRVPPPLRFPCPINVGDGLMLRSNSSLESEVIMQNCELRVEVPVQAEEVQRLENSTNNFSVETMLGVIKKGFIVSYSDDCLDCINSGGTCAYDGQRYSPSCWNNKGGK